MRDLGLPDGLRDQRGQRVEIDGPEGPFVLYAMHLQKPGISPSSVEIGFRSHRRLVDRLVDAVQAETLPVVVAGDLNLGDRTSGYRALTDVLDDGMRAGWTGPTSLRRTTRLLLARIDHVFAPETWCAEDSRTFTMRGSDHRGVATTIGPCG
jgi:endonuclease/exonuclease/phosphatase (EEP) superfamily protein YafD